MEQPFILAFLEWMANANINDILRANPHPDRDAVEIEFPRTHGILKGYADGRGISIAAIKDDECWDFVLMEDLLAEEVEDGWRCSLCTPSDRAHFRSIKPLWEDHILRPLLTWIEARLRTSQGITLCEHDGITWAVLCAADEGKGQFHPFQEV